jgi:hypothetical protein
MFMQNSGAPRGENVKSYVNVIARSQRVRLSAGPMTGSATKQSILAFAAWIASRSLSSGAHSRDPLARNDVVDKPVQMRAIDYE